MSSIESQSEATYDPQRVAAEVLELGAALFDDVIDAAAAQSGNADAEPFPEADVRAAAAEFFTALRLLLGLPE
jgi:hypothetical protein